MSHPDFNLVAQNPQSTVVAEFIPSPKKAEHYQSESQLEKEFIVQLQTQGYEYLPIHQETDLIKNLRKQLEKLNNFHFTDQQREDFFHHEIANASHGIPEKTATIQENYIKTIILENGESKNIYLLDKTNIHNNHLQVINQYETHGNKKNRYDVTILVNGLPLVHIELKKRGVALQEAFNQINRYQKESFRAGSGLFEYIQLFVISNGTQSKYYSNTTRFSHIKEQRN